jgi:hypothetical protein
MIANNHQYTYKQQDTAASYNSTVEYEELHLDGYGFERAINHVAKRFTIDRSYQPRSTKQLVLKAAKLVSLNHHPENLCLSYNRLRLGLPQNQLLTSETPVWQAPKTRQFKFPPIEGFFAESGSEIKEKSYLFLSASEFLDITRLRPSKDIMTQSFLAEEERSLNKYLAGLKPRNLIFQLVESLDSTDLEEINPSLLLELVTRSKHHSAAFQIHFQRMSTVSKKLTNMIISIIPNLVQEKYGCQFLRRVVVQSDEAMQVLCKFCIKCFVQLSTNEYSSRVMQTLAVVQPLFRLKCLEAICHFWGILTCRAPVYFLLEVCLKSSHNTEEAFRRVGNRLLESVKRANENKPLRKISCLYLQYCDKDDLLKLSDQFKNAYAPNEDKLSRKMKDILQERNGMSPNQSTQATIRPEGPFSPHLATLHKLNE